MSSWSWWGTLRDEARTRLWPMPVLAVVVAICVGIGLPRLDAALEDDLPGLMSAYLFSGGADAARTVLSVIATSLITVTSLTFSLTVVTLQLASSQYSPRLLRTFTRDRVVHATLALFLGAFVYALTVLRTVRTEESGAPEFVPQLSVTVAYLLVLLSVLGLVVFLAHLAREIRVETILATVREEGRGTIERVLPVRDATPSARPSPPLDQHGSLLFSPSSGILQGVDEERLREAAAAVGAVIAVDVPVGEALVDGVPFGSAWSASPGRDLTDDELSQLREHLTRVLVVGFERTSRQDVSLGLRQLTDVAVKALSPGINDPTTAVHALHHSAVLLVELLRRDLSPQVVEDDAGRLAGLVAQRSFTGLLDLAVSQPRVYGRDDPEVSRALLELLLAVAWRAGQPEKSAISDQLARLREAIEGGGLDAAHRAGLATLADEVQRVLANVKE